MFGMKGAGPLGWQKDEGIGPEGIKNSAGHTLEKRIEGAHTEDIIYKTAKQERGNR